MLQFSNLDKVMDARDHSKNRTSSKSLMSREDNRNSTKTMTLLKKILIIPILIFFVCPVFAHNSTEKTGSLLWKISGNGLTQPSYILGTHHFFPFSFLDSIAGVKKAFASSEQMVGELVMQDLAALALEMQKTGMMPQDSTWQLLLSEDDYRFVDEELTAFFGVGLQNFGRLKPYMVSLSYTAVLYQRKFPQINPSESMDIWFQQQAANREIPIIGLETAQNQIDALGISSLKQQAADLVCALKNTDLAELALMKLNRMYRSADLTGISEMLREETPCSMSAEQENALNDARNKRWLEKLPAIMSEKSSFVAVGLLHLVGEAGLLYGLEQAGYTVEAVVSE